LITKDNFTRWPI